MRAVESMAFVEVQFASDTVTQTTRDVRYTFAGILSNLGKKNNLTQSKIFQSYNINLLHLGGTLGLFLGMSLLSMVEITYHLVRMICTFGQSTRGQRRN